MTYILRVLHRTNCHHGDYSRRGSFLATPVNRHQLNSDLCNVVCHQFGLTFGFDQVLDEDCPVTFRNLDIVLFNSRRHLGSGGLRVPTPHTGLTLERLCLVHVQSIGRRASSARELVHVEDGGRAEQLLERVGVRDVALLDEALLGGLAEALFFLLRGVGRPTKQSKAIVPVITSAGWTGITRAGYRITDDSQWKMACYDVINAKFSGSPTLALA